MKVACIGNMNNMLFPVSRYLADKGHDVTLFLLDEYEHFLPSTDVFTDDERVKLVELGWYNKNFYSVSPKEVEKIFSGFEFFIGTDYAPAFCLKARITIDIFLPAGGDLFDYPFRSMGKFKLLPEIFRIEMWRCALYQRFSLPLCSCISMDQAHDVIERYLPILKMDKIKRIPAVPLLYVEQYTNEYFSNSAYYQQMKEIRDANDFLVVQHGRQSWIGGPSDLHYKGNEILIKGFALFVKANPEKKSKLLLLEYGLDVQHTKDMVRELGIDHHVIWFPKMFRKDLMAIIKFCDAGVGELGRSWISYGAVYEILAMKVNFIGGRNDEDFIDKYPELYPMYNAKSELDILNSLNEISSNRDAAQTRALASHNWFIKYGIRNSIDRITEIMSDTKRTKKPIGLVVHIRLALIDGFVNSIIFLNKCKLQFMKLGRTANA